MIYTAKLIIFSNSYDDINYPAYLYIGLVFWYFINLSIIKSTGLFLNHTLLLNIKVSPLSLFKISYINNIYKLTLNFFLIIPLFFLNEFKFNTLFFLLALFLNLILVYYLTKLTCSIAIIFKDFHNLMTTVLNLLFFLTPIFWHPSILPNDKKFILDYNPFYYLIEILREAALNARFYEDGFKVCIILIFLLFILNKMILNKIIINVSKRI